MLHGIYTHLAILVLFSTCSLTIHADIVTDPLGDTFGAGSVQIDITSVTTNLLPGEIDFHVAFGGPIAPPSAFAPNSVVGYLDLDTDQNPATGVNAWAGQPTVIPGVEYIVDLFSEATSPGNADVLDTSTGFPTGSAGITFGADYFDLTIPTSLIGNSNGLLNWGLIVGTYREPTDTATGTINPPVVGAVPEPASLATWGLLLCCCAFARAIRRRLHIL